ncbi:MAG TPA: response regulator transcription factor [Chitinophagaceae bacterium]|jgi:DNA-binding response OmpR family regulator|nr:response regulator transcription factor [Chitinophagaceae bacterium]
MKKPNVLLIEDESALAEIVRESLESNGFMVRQAMTLSAATLAFRQQAPDIIVADVMMPDGNGFEWVATLRQQDRRTPVLFLTARSQTSDVVKGFEQGGNDYLKKPFSIAELVVRMRSLLQNQWQPAINTQAAVVWKLGHFTFHYPAGELVVGDHVRNLTSREADILNLLLLHRNQLVSRTQILQDIWHQTDYFSGRSLDVFITKLRRYLKKDPTLKIINVRSIGYRLTTG